MIRTATALAIALATTTPAAAQDWRVETTIDPFTDAETTFVGRAAEAPSDCGPGRPWIDIICRDGKHGLVIDHACPRLHRRANQHVEGMIRFGSGRPGTIFLALSTTGASAWAVPTNAARAWTKRIASADRLALRFLDADRAPLTTMTFDTTGLAEALAGAPNSCDWAGHFGTD